MTPSPMRLGEPAKLTDAEIAAMRAAAEKVDDPACLSLACDVLALVRELQQARATLRDIGTAVYLADRGHGHVSWKFATDNAARIIGEALARAALPPESNDV